MPNKTLITVGLSDLATSDVEGLGSVFERDGKVYAWVKNKGTTSLVASGCCIEVFTSVLAAVNHRVLSADGAGASTGLVTMPCGVPVTAIGPSGSDTGDHGWVQVKGITQVRIIQLTTATTGGEIAVATSSLPSTGVWGQAIADNADSATTSYHYAKRVVLLQPIATTGAATAVSCVVMVQCRG